MNERIRELLEEAGVKYVVMPSPATAYEKFAELIIRECINLCSDEWNGDADTYEASNAYNECADLIKEHFGVE